MTPEQMERAIEFLLGHHSRVSADIERHSEQIERHSEQIVQLTANIQALATQGELNRRETREAIDNLIVANEVTRDLAQKVAALQLQMGQRVV